MPRFMVMAALSKRRLDDSCYNFPAVFDSTQTCNKTAKSNNFPVKNNFKKLFL